MNETKPVYEKLVLVCTNCGKSSEEKNKCGNRNSEELLSKLKKLAVQKNLKGKVRVMRSGCLDLCGQGPVISLQPQNKFFKEVAETELEMILEKSLE